MGATVVVMDAGELWHKAYGREDLPRPRAKALELVDIEPVDSSFVMGVEL